MKTLLSRLHPRAWGRLLGAIIGEVKFGFTPPRWPFAVLHSMHRHPGRWAGVLFSIGFLYYGTLEVQRWWEAHKPRPREVVAPRSVTASLGVPSVTVRRQGELPKPEPLRLIFSDAAARLELVNKDNPPGVSISPNIKGRWIWNTDRSLYLYPEEDWKPGEEFEVKFDVAQLSDKVVLNGRPAWNFTVTPFTARWSAREFYTNPKTPDEHQVTATLETSHPTSLEEVKRCFSYRVPSNADLFGGAKAPFKITEDAESQHCRFFLRSVNMALPAKEDFVELGINVSLTSALGGVPVNKPVTDKVRVPDVYSGFRIAEVSTQIIRTSEGQPEQFIFVSTNGYAQPDEMAKNVQAWFLAETVRHVRVIKLNNRDVEELLPVWSKEGEITSEYARDVKPVALKIVETEKEDDDAPMATRHGFKFLQEQPGRLFVRVAKNTKGVGGFLLERNEVKELTVPVFPKEVKLLGEGGILAINGERKVNVMTRGVQHLRVTLARVPASQVNHLVVFNEGQFQLPNMYPMEQANIAHFHREILTVPARNNYQANYVGFDFASALQAADVADTDASRGMFFIKFEGVRPATAKERQTSDDPEPTFREWRNLQHQDDESWNGSSGTIDNRFILVTDLGLIAKRNTNGTRDMFVQSVAKGEPVAGVQLTVLAKNGEFLAQAVTDAQGHAQLLSVENMRREKEPCAITARLGNDLAFMPFRRGDHRLQYSRFDIDGILASEMQTLLGFVFTERGVYRPGDSVHVAGIVRRRDWQGELANLPLEIVVDDAKGNELMRARFSLPQDGFFDWNTETKESDPTGQYEVTLNRLLPDHQREQLGHTSFRVEDFEPDRTKITTTLNTPPVPGWIAPKDVKALVKLETLFGTPAADRRVTARLDLSAAHFAFSQFPDFTFHNRSAYAFKAGQDEDETAAGKKIDLGELKSDGQGVAEFNLKLERFDSGSFAMRFFADAFEPDSGKSVQGAVGALVSSMPYVVGYKADGQLGYISKDTPRTVKFICVSPELKSIASPALKAKLTRIRFVSVLTKQKNGNYEYVSTRRESVVGESELKINDDGTDYPLVTSEAAEFRLDLLDGSDVAATVGFTVVGKGDPGRSMEHDAELEMKLAKREWNSGDSLELSLNAPYTGAGLITIERENVLGWQWFKSPTTSSTQHILVPPGFEGTAYVNVAWVRALDSPEIFASPLSYAVQPFEGNKSAHSMKVTLESASMLKPGTPLQISYSSEANGRIAIFAVDEGILQITNYKLPQPLSRFLEKRALETQTWQMLDLILPEFSQVMKQSAYGGDGDAGMTLNPFKRRREAPVVFWSGLVACGPETKTVTYNVPDYFDGRLRVMAVAVAGSKIGTTETTSIVRSPLVLQPNAPTFVAPGDDFVVSLSITNTMDVATGTADEVKFHVEVSEHLAVSDATDQTLSIARGKEASLRLRLKARDVLGGAELNFTAIAGGEEVKRRATMSVRPASPYMTEVKSGWFRLAKQDVPLQRTVYPQFRKSEAVVSAMPLGLARGLEAYLADYPHGCSEQITSRAMSRLLLAGEVDFGFDQAESARQIEYAMRLLAGRQAGNGGFGYWSADPGNAGTDFLSVYVMHFLTEAKALGHAPPSGMMESAMVRMKDIARARNGDADTQAAAIYLLTRNGEVTTNYLLNLRDGLEKSQPKTWRTSLAAAYLASTYALLQQRTEGVKLMKAYWAEVDKTPALKSWWGGWANDPQVKQAQGFELLCRHFPEIAKNVGYDELQMITEPVRANHFNTLTAAHGVMALKAYSSLVQKTDIKLNVMAVPMTGEPVALLPEASGMRRTVFDSGLKTLRFIRDSGAGDLGAFYSVTESGFDHSPVIKAASDGIEVIRALVDDKGRPVNELKVGETATERILIRNNSKEILNDVSLLDLLPGGFLFAPNGLKAGLRTMARTDYVDVREDRAAIFLSLPKSDTITIEYPVKPQCAGIFAVPPVYAECMYDRAVKGHGVTGRIVVKSAE